MAKLVAYTQTLADFVSPHRYRMGAAYLRGDELAAYDLLARGLIEHKERIELPARLPVDRALHICKRVREDIPELITVKGVSASYSGDSARPDTIAIKANYFFDNQSAIKYLQRMEMTAQPLVAAARNLSVPGRIELAHDWLASNCTYTPSRDSFDYTAMGPLLLRAGRCYGIAKAFKYLLDRMDVMSSVCVGKTLKDGKSEPGEKNLHSTHAWNIVNFAGTVSPRWSYVDVTFDLVDEHGFVGHAFYGLSDREASLSHVPAAPHELPPCPMPINWHRSHDLVCSTEAEARAAVSRELDRGNYLIELKSGCPSLGRDEFKQIVKEGVRQAGFDHPFSSYSTITSSHKADVVQLVIKRQALAV